MLSTLVYTDISSACWGYVTSATTERGVPRSAIVDARHVVTPSQLQVPVPNQPSSALPSANHARLQSEPLATELHDADMTATSWVGTGGASGAGASIGASSGVSSLSSPPS